MHYIGETSRALRKRMYEHKSSVIKDGQITPASHHFKNDGHSHKCMQFSVLSCCLLGCSTGANPTTGPTMLESVS